MLRRQDLIYLVDKWTRYEKNIPLSDSKVKEVVQSFVEDVEQILTMDDKEEQEAFDKMFESLSGIILYTVYYDWNSPRCFNCFHLMEVVDIEETLTDIIYHYKCPKCGRTRTIKIPIR